jgi:hypothetical protein
MARVVTGDPFRQKTFSATLATPGKGSTAAFGPHAGAETVLALASSF